MKDSPFSVTLTARDQFNNTVPSFDGTVSLTGGIGGGTTGTLFNGSPVPTQSGSGNYTLGHSFTPSSDITVTAARSYFGTKMSIWTDAGLLLASVPITAPSGSWSETPFPARFNWKRVRRIGWRSIQGD